MYPNCLKKAATPEWHELDEVHLHSAKIAATTIKISFCTQMGARRQLHNDKLMFDVVCHYSAEIAATTITIHSCTQMG